jgi:hypothetical protein
VNATAYTMSAISIFGFEVSGAILLMSLFFTLISLGANWRLFLKCDQPGWTAFVPGYNVVVAMRIIGRPDSHALLFLIPGYNVYFALRTMIELAQSFGKRTSLDYFLVVFFNVFYMLNLGLAYQEEYDGPVYGKLGVKKDKSSMGLSAA